MMYSLALRLGRTTTCVQHILKRVDVRLQQPRSSLLTLDPVFQPNHCPGSKWAFYHTRSLYTGVYLCSRKGEQKDTDQLSVSRSPHTPPRGSATQKGNVTCVAEHIPLLLFPTNTFNNGLRST